MASEDPLLKLITSCFSAGELRRFVRALPNGQVMADSLPGDISSKAHLVDAAVQVLHAHGAVNEGFWLALLNERPGRRHDILASRGVGGTMEKAASSAKIGSTVVHAENVVIADSVDTIRMDE